MTRKLQGALQDWRKTLSTKRVITNSNQLSAAEKSSTFATQQKILAILKPKTISEIQDCLKIANKYHIPIYPISSGKNWGFGSQVPVVSNSVILNLQGLNRIIDYDDKLGYITIQAGVTQKQVSTFLCQNKSPFFISVTGSSPDSSIIGNILERGDASGVYADRCHYIAALEVILPNGDCIHTGYANFGANKLAKLHRTGLGAQIDGLFIQSNFGIITQMTIWLCPIPNYFQIMTFSLSDNKLLGYLADTIRTLKLSGTLKSTISIWNASKSQSNDSKWRGSTALYSVSKSVGLAERTLIKNSIHSIKLHFMDYSHDDIMNWLYTPQSLLNNFQKFLALTRYSQYLGIPNEKNISPIFAQNNELRGILCACVAVPMTNQDVRQAVRTIENIAKKTGFKPHIALLCIWERYLTIPIFIIYDRFNSQENKNAILCHDQILEKMMALGYLPTRLGIQSMQVLSHTEVTYKTFMQQLKTTLDPFSIVAPGRYDMY